MHLLRSRKFWLAAGLLVASALGGAAYALPPWPSLLTLFFDFVGFTLALLAGLALVSQFVLPVQTLRERRRSFDHFMNFVTGQAGPVLFVRDGQLIGTKAELRRYGHGVALIDSVSAVVLEQAAAQAGWSRGARTAAGGPPLVRAGGPGIVFIRPGERIVKTLDLRTQARSMNVEALTGDGIECSTFVSVSFGLDPDPEGRRTQQPPSGERVMPTETFNPHSAFRAVYGVALGEQQTVEWTELPLMVAAECFRIVLAEYRLDQLLRPTQPELGRLKEMKDKINATVKHAPVLAERGIAVHSVGIGDLKLPREVVNQRVRVWAANWQKVAIDREAAVQRQAITTFQDKQKETQTELFAELRQLLSANPDPLARDALWRILVRALQRASGDPQSQKLPPDVQQALDSLGETR
jgi:regulator of protease activity HflC (stomatin/prohibitin superfamily)